MTRFDENQVAENHFNLEYLILLVTLAFRTSRFSPA